MIINHNIPAIIANNALNRANSSLSKASSKLSTGYRINNAKDDAAGLAISNKMSAQLKGLGMAQRNVEDASSLLETADSALNEVNEMVQRLREMAVEGAHGIYTTSDREKMQSEADQLIREINDVSEKIKFNGQNLLDGNKSFTFQVGQNTGLNLTINLGSVSAMRLGNLGAPGESDYVKFTASYDGSGSNGQTGTEDVTVRSLASLASDYSDYYAEGITEAYENLVQEMESFDAFAEDYEELIASGVDPDSSEAITAYNKVRDIYRYIEDTSDALSEMIQETDNGTSASRSGAADPSAAVSSADSALGSYMSAMKDRLDTLRSSSVDSGKAAGDSAFGNLETALKDGLIPAAESYFDSIEGGAGVFSSQEGCQAVLGVCDSVVSLISKMRSVTGAAINRLDYTLASLQTSDNNMQDALSRVKDTDMAKEMSEYSKYNVIIQAGISMLSQANQRPEQILSLIQ